MDNDQLTNWLRDRGVSEDTVKDVVSEADQIKTIYKDLQQIGAAMDHGDWLEEITTTGDGLDPLNQVVWFLLGLSGSLIAYIEQSGE